MASYVTCSVHSHKIINVWVEKLIAIIHEYCWIIDAYVSDFYTHNHWNKVQCSVQEYFDAVEPPDLAWMLDVSRSGHPLSKSVIPLSLLALHCCVQSLSLKRVMVDTGSLETRSCLASSLCTRMAGVLKNENPVLRKSSVIDTDASHKPNYKNGQCMDMQHIFRKHVKPKKQHEIDKLGQVINLLSQLSSCSNVVDVGAGLGHLSRLLTFQHGLRVTTVEAANDHAPLAAQYDRALKKDVQKANDKKKDTSAELASNKSVKNAEDLNTSFDDTLLNETLSLQNNLNFNSENNGSMSFLEKHCDSRPLSCSNSTKYSPLHSLVSRTCKYSESNCDIQPLILASEERNKGKSDVIGSPGAKNSDEEDALPNHIVCRVHPDIASSQFLNIITQKDLSMEDEAFNNFILVGLHACGDLTPTLLRVFVNCKTAVALASVACCYMKLSPPKPD